MSTYTVIIIGLIIVAGGLGYMALAPMINDLVVITNDYSDDGVMSSQTLGAVEFGVNLFLMIPLIIIGGMIWYTYSRHVDEKRRLG